MKSYTTLRNLYGTLTKNTATANLTVGDQLIMDRYRELVGQADFPVLHRLRTALTVASTQFVALPYDMDQVESVYVTVSSRRYTPKLIHSREQWDKLNLSTFTSDIPSYAFVFAGQIGLWPTPATSSNVISINGKVKVVDLNTADITSSTITTLANGSTALTVSGGLTAQMAGFWIRPTFSTTANTGDGEWYEISSVTSATVAVLVRAYGGVSITAGTAACTIAQMPLLPDGYFDAPVWGAAGDYWTKENDDRGAAYTSKFETAKARMLKERVSLTQDLVLDNGGDVDIINPNLTVSL